MRRLKMTVACLLALALPFVASSCTQEEEMYSCNPEVDNWVKENKDLIRRMTRSQWCELDYQVSTASYTAFTQSQKIDFWMEKLEEVKKLDWATEELAHIQKVEDFISTHPEFFGDEKLSEKELDDVETYFVKWTKYGKRHFGWSNKTAMAIVCTGFKMIDKNGNMQIPQNGTRSRMTANAVMSSSVEFNCNCNKDSYFTCIMDPLGSCDDSSCKWDGRDGCGFLMLEECDGTCGGI